MFVDTVTIKVYTDGKLHITVHCLKHATDAQPDVQQHRSFKSVAALKRPNMETPGL